MRVWGTVMLAIGSIFMILFVLGELVKTDIGVAPFFISGFLIFIGWNLRASGMGILQSKPVTVGQQSNTQANAPTGQPSTNAGEFSTIELPLTPEVIALIARQNARMRRILVYVDAGCLVFFTGLGAVLRVTDSNPAEGNGLFIFFSGTGVLCAVLIYGISWLTTQKSVRSDLRGATYRRTTGPVKVVRIGGGALVRLADRAFMMNGRNAMAELTNLNWATVDYTPHGHVILGAWNREGRSIFSLQGYNPGSGAPGAR